MALSDAVPITNTQGMMIAIGIAIACLLLRSWLTSPRRRFPRIVFAPPPPVLPVRHRQRRRDDNPAWPLDGLGEEAATFGDPFRRSPPRVQDVCDLRH
jgi:hypothetical protein